MNDKFVQGWKSPINVITKEIIKDLEDGVMCEVKTIVDVDRDELFKALNYDREQFEQGCAHGYAMGKIDGYNEAMEKIRSALFPEKQEEKNEE